MDNGDSINWIGAMRGGRIELRLTPAEVLERVREAFPGLSYWEPFRAEVEGLSFRLWPANVRGGVPQT